MPPIKKLGIKVGARVVGSIPFKGGTITRKFPRPGVPYPWYVKWDGENYESGPYSTAELKAIEE
jgi:hypothetical protein